MSFGKYKRIRYKGIVCDRCGVEVTEKKFVVSVWDISIWLSLWLIFGISVHCQIKLVIYWVLPTKKRLNHLL